MLRPNQFVVMKDALGGSSSAVGIVDQSGKAVKKLVFDQEQVWGIRSRNVQQTMALELLLRQDIPLVTLIGKAGTGKTLLALAAGLLQTEDLGNFKNLLSQGRSFLSEKISAIFRVKKKKNFVRGSSLFLITWNTCSMQKSRGA